ncbi:hypothetical protein B0H11DRAFT_376841 [Mycena galericulata]|nr:hypothetical protein B0H11DRAFT_376841 [Mycena galericulata]
MVKTYLHPSADHPPPRCPDATTCPVDGDDTATMTAASLSPPPPLRHRQDHDAKTKRCGRLGTPGRPHAAVRGRHDSARRRPGGWTHFDSGSVALSSCRVGVVLVRKSECLWLVSSLFLLICLILIGFLQVVPPCFRPARLVRVPPRRRQSPHAHMAPHARRHSVSFSSPTARHCTPAGTHPLFAPRRQGPKPARPRPPGIHAHKHRRRTRIYYPLLRCVRHSVELGAWRVIETL